MKKEYIYIGLIIMTIFISLVIPLANVVMETIDTINTALTIH